MHVTLIHQSEPLPIDGSVRRLRVGLLAEYLLAHGHRITWVTGTFDHRTRAHRFRQNTSISVAERFDLQLLHTTGYSSAVSFSRILDHLQFGRRLREYFDSAPRTDVVFAGYPTIECGVEAAKAMQRGGAPVVIDFRDRWPRSYLYVLPWWLRGPASPFCRWYETRIRRSLRLITHYTASSPDLLHYGRHLTGNRERCDWIPFTYDSRPLTSAEETTARRFWQEKGVDFADGSIYIVYSGNLNTEQQNIDLDGSLAEIAALAERAERRIRLLVCGDGRRKSALERRFASSQRIFSFPGWVSRNELSYACGNAHYGLLPYLPNEDFINACPNKFVEYLFGGLTVLSSLRGGYLNQQYGPSGIVVEFGRGYGREQLRSHIARNDGRWAELRSQIKLVFAEKFEANRVHGKLTALLTEAVAAGPAAVDYRQYLPQ